MLGTFCGTQEINKGFNEFLTLNGWRENGDGNYAGDKWFELLDRYK
jgi:hypothetical protein